MILGVERVFFFLWTGSGSSVGLLRSVVVDAFAGQLTLSTGSGMMYLCVLGCPESCNVQYREGLGSLFLFPLEGGLCLSEFAEWASGTFIPVASLLPFSIPIILSWFPGFGSSFFDPG